MSEPTTEARFWRDEEKWARAGSGMTRDQKTGASMVFAWLSENSEARASQPLTLDVERLAEAMDTCLPEDFSKHQPGNAVRARVIAREYELRGRR